MSSPTHTYGPTCHFASQSDPPNEFMRRASLVSEIPPRIRAQFFYTSALPIDDPLSAVPLSTSGSASTASKHPPRPFSAYDNAALDEAWEGLQQTQKGDKGRRWQSKGERKGGDKRSSKDGRSSDGTGANVFDSGTKEPSTARNPPEWKWGTSDTNADAAKDGQSADETRHKTDKQDDQPPTIPKSNAMPVSSSLSRGTLGRPVKDSRSSMPSTKGGPYGASPSQKATTGTPFLRAPSRKERSRSPARNSEGLVITQSVDGPDDEETPSRPSSKSGFGTSRSVPSPKLKSGSHTRPGSQLSELELELVEEHQVVVPVGVSRLHQVEMPGKCYSSPRFRKLNYFR